MDIPTPKTAAIKRHLSEQETETINQTVLDGDSTEGTTSVDDLRRVGRDAGEKRPFVLREHLMQRPFAKNPAFAELARKVNESKPQRKR